MVGIEAVSAESGNVVIAKPWRPEAGQYSGFLHAGLVRALIDTACGFAAATVLGRLLASHYWVNCLCPAVGERFIASAGVVKPGKTQVLQRAICTPLWLVSRRWLPPAKHCSLWL
jgi:uncharacterized protein (TIGR00369 family)